MENFEITKSELFRHPKFGNLRVLTDEKGDPWFVGKVVAEVLGYTNPHKAVSDHVLSEDRKVLRIRNSNETLELNLWQGNDTTNKTIINESGLYSLILGSQLPSAIEFKHWVTSEVLPQIRRTGGYIPTHDDKGKPLTDLEIMSLAFQIHERTIAERDRKIAEQDETILRRGARERELHDDDAGGEGARHDTPGADEAAAREGRAIHAERTMDALCRLRQPRADAQPHSFLSRQRGCDSFTFLPGMDREGAHVPRRHPSPQAQPEGGASAGGARSPASCPEGRTT